MKKKIKPTVINESKDERVERVDSIKPEGSEEHSDMTFAE